MTQAPTSQTSPFGPRIPLMPSHPVNFNAVKIEINDPTVNGSSGSAGQASNPGYYYNYPTNSAYAMPTNQMGNMPAAPYVIPQAQPQQADATPVPPQPQPVNSQPVDTTAPTVVDQKPEAQPQPAPAPVATPAPAETKPADAAQTPADVKAADAPKSQDNNKVDVKSINDMLVSTDLEKQKTAIHQIAEIGQNSPDQATQLLNPDVFNNLNNIINKDTSTLEGPSKEQIGLRQKEMSGAKLTPEETAKAEKLSPMEFAEMNKQISIYTLAVLQKDLRGEVDKEATKNNMQPVSINELPGSDNIVNNLKTNPNPIIREACMSALLYVAKPEDNNVIVPLLNVVAKEDKDDNVKATAQALVKKLDPDNKFADKVADDKSADAAKATDDKAKDTKAEGKKDAKATDDKKDAKAEDKKDTKAADDKTKDAKKDDKKAA